LIIFAHIVAQIQPNNQPKVSYISEKTGCPGYRSLQSVFSDRRHNRSNLYVLSISLHPHPAFFQEREQSVPHSGISGEGADCTLLTFYVCSGQLAMVFLELVMVFRE